MHHEKACAHLNEKMPAEHDTIDELQQLSLTSDEIYDAVLKVGLQQIVVKLHIVMFLLCRCWTNVVVVGHLLFNRQQTSPILHPQLNVLPLQLQMSAWPQMRLSILANAPRRLHRRNPQQRQQRLRLSVVEQPQPLLVVDVEGVVAVHRRGLLLPKPIWIFPSRRP